MEGVELTVSSVEVPVVVLSVHVDTVHLYTNTEPVTKEIREREPVTKGGEITSN